MFATTQAILAETHYPGETPAAFTAAAMLSGMLLFGSFLAVVSLFAQGADGGKHSKSGGNWFVSAFHVAIARPLYLAALWVRGVPEWATERHSAEYRAAEHRASIKVVGEVRHLLRTGRHDVAAGYAAVMRLMVPAEA